MSRASRFHEGHGGNEQAGAGFMRSMVEMSRANRFHEGHGGNEQRCRLREEHGGDEQGKQVPLGAWLI